MSVQPLSPEALALGAAGSPSARVQTPLEPSAQPPVTADSQDTSVLSIVVYLLSCAERDGWELFESKIHFMCAQVLGWSLAWTAEAPFTESLYAVADGYLIQEVTDFFAPLGIARDEVFTVQDCVDAGILERSEVTTTTPVGAL